MAALPNLTEVILSDTLVSEQGVLQLLPLKKLISIDFNHLPWSAPIMEMSPQWPDLQMLGISHHWIRPDTVAAWTAHPSLTDLFIRGDLKHEQLQLLRPMERLKFLALVRNHSIDSEMLRGMNRFPKLINLAFVVSPLQPETLREVRSLPRLRLLSLQHGEYTDEHLAALQEADHLEHLQLFGTQVTPAGVAKFQVAHPRCRVESDLPKSSTTEIK